MWSIVASELLSLAFAVWKLGPSRQPGNRLSVGGTRVWSTLIVGGVFQAANLSLVATLSAQAEFGELEVTEFAVAQRWTLILTFAASALAPTFISRMAVATNGSSRQSARARRRLFYTYGLFTAVPALGVFLLADQIVAATTPTVPGAAWPVRLAAVGVGARLANQLLGNTAVAEDRWKMWLASDLVLAAGLLASGGIAARSYGAPGAVLAASTAYAVSAAFLAVAPRLVHRNAGLDS